MSGLLHRLLVYDRQKLTFEVLSSKPNQLAKSVMAHRLAIDANLLGVGSYTVSEAARLLRVPPLNVRRWLGGYSYKSNDNTRHVMPPLWTSQIPKHENHVEIGFRDLIELRFVSAFLAAGLSILTIRRCLEHARSIVDDERPFSTRRFRTDGKTIFFELAEQAAGLSNTDALPVEVRRDLIDLRNRQFVFREVITQTFKDLELDDAVVSRWRPFHGRGSIVIDPKRAFGQPITSSSGVPTSNLAAAVKAEGSSQRVAYLYGVPLGEVRDAVKFESELAAA